MENWTLWFNMTYSHDNNNTFKQGGIYRLDSADPYVYSPVCFPLWANWDDLHVVLYQGL